MYCSKLVCLGVKNMSSHYIPKVCGSTTETVLRTVVHLTNIHNFSFLGIFYSNREEHQPITTVQKNKIHLFRQSYIAVQHTVSAKHILQKF